jgi:hypothetical protein
VKPLLAALRLLPIPLLVLAAALLALDSRGPFWLGTNSDPSYVYALNSLRLLEGEAPTHLDHPGLTVQLFGAAVFWTSHRLAHRSQPLAEDVLANPERYLGAAVGTLVVLFAACLFVFGLAVFKLTRHWGLAWIAQLGPLLSPSVFFELTDFKPEPVLYLVATLLASVICAAIADGNADKAPLPVLFGVLVGVGVATKLTALSLLVCPLILHRSWRARLLCCSSAAGSFLLCAVPALPNWRLVVGFVWRVSSGSGLYGTGIANERPYLAQWKRIGIEEAPFFLVLLVAIAVVLHSWQRSARRQTRPGVRALVAVLATSFAQVAMVAMHPYQPRYLLPALALSGLLLMLSFRALSASPIEIADRMGLALVSALLVGLAGLQIPRFLRRDAQLRAATRCQIEARSKALTSGCRIASYYRGSSPALALFQADSWAQRLFHERLQRLHPDEVFVYADGTLHSFAGPVDWERLAPVCVVLQGSPGGPRHPFSPPGPRPFDGFPALAAAEPVYSCDSEAVFRRAAPSRD